MGRLICSIGCGRCTAEARGNRRRWWSWTWCTRTSLGARGAWASLLTSASPPSSTLGSAPSQSSPPALTSRTLFCHGTRIGILWSTPVKIQNLPCNNRQMTDRKKKKTRIGMLLPSSIYSKLSLSLSLRPGEL